MKYNIFDDFIFLNEIKINNENRDFFFFEKMKRLFR